jgi:post-segregation antitoxin (ccd killing protein)
VKPTREDPPWLRPRPRKSLNVPSKATVYIGDALMSRLYRLRDLGVDINVSRVCQAALASVLDEAETAVSDSDKPRRRKSKGESD